MDMYHQTITPRKTDTASAFPGVIVESYLLIAFVYYLFYHDPELRSSSLPFGRPRASSGLLSLNHDLATAIHVNALGHRLTVELTTVEGVLIIIIHLSVIR